MMLAAYTVPLLLLAIGFSVFWCIIADEAKTRKQEEEASLRTQLLEKDQEIVRLTNALARSESYVQAINASFVNTQIRDRGVRRAPVMRTERELPDRAIEL